MSRQRPSRRRRRLAERQITNSRYAKPHLERLEARLVLSAIHGIKFEDVDADGIFDPTVDRRFGGVTIGLFGDRDGDGTDELQLTRTAPNGEFSFVGLAPGPFTLSESPPAGTVPTTPVSRQLSLPARTQLVAQADQAVPGQGTAQVLGPELMFGNAVAAAIHGFKFEDVNKNGSYEPGTDRPFPGVLVGLFGDADGNGGLDLRSTVTDSQGRFSFEDLFPGPYTVGEIPPVGTAPTTPASFDVSVQSGQAVMALAGQAQLAPGQTEIVLGSALMFGNGELFVEVDQFQLSLGQLLIETPAGRELVAATGPAEVHVTFDGVSEGDALDSDGNRLDDVRAELVSLQLSGPSSLGQVEIGLRSDIASVGQIEERQQRTRGRLDVAPFTPGATASSFFDVWPAITVAGQPFFTDRPLRLDELILQHKPPLGAARYVSDARRPADQQQVFNLQLSVAGSLFFNEYGGQEKWLRSETNFLWYLVLPSGQLIQWDGTGGQLSGTSLGLLDQAAYHDPLTHLVNAASATDIPVPLPRPPVELLTPDGDPTGIFIVREVHHPLPYVEVDTFDISLGQLLIQAPDGSTELVAATGPAQVEVFFDGATEGVAFDDDLDQRDEVVTELVALDMTGFSPAVGAIQIGLREDVRSMGQIAERRQLVRGTLDVAPFTADATAESFFDVWPVVTVGGQRLVTNRPIRLSEPNLQHKPPRGDARYINDARQPANQQQVFNLNLQVSGDLFFDLYKGREKWLRSASTSLWYFILPTGELIQWDGTAGALTGASLGFLDTVAHQDPVAHIVNARSAGDIPIPAAAGPTPLLTENGDPTGFSIIREVHQPEPFVEIDSFDLSLGQLLIQRPDGGTELVVATGPAEAHVYFDGATEGVAHDDDLDQRDEVISELVSLQLNGTSSLGPLEIGIRTDIRSMGQIEEQAQLNPGRLDVAPFTAGAAADSFFDVWPEITLGVQRLITDVPLRLVEPNLLNKPPQGDARYVSQAGPPVELIDAASGQGTGIFILREVHQPSPFVEVDTFDVSLGQLLLRLPNGETELVAAEGPAEVHVLFDGAAEGIAFDDDLDQRDEVITEIVSLEMTGVSSLGAVEIGLRSDVRSWGQIEEQTQLNRGRLDVAPFTPNALAESFFDVWPLITVDGQRLVTDGPLRLFEPNLAHKPPQGSARYINGNRAADQQQVFDLRLFVSDSLYFDLYGGREKWLLSATDSSWYFILPSGEFRRWDGTAGELSGRSLGFLPLPAYQDPVRHIVNAATPADIPVLPPLSPVELLTETGQPTGIFIVREVHHPLPFVEVDAFASTLGQLLLEVPNSPGILTSQPNLPPTDGVYHSAPGATTVFTAAGLQVELQDIRHRPLAAPPPLTTSLGDNELAQFQTSLTATASITAASLGLNAVPVSLELQGTVQTVVLGKANQTTGSFPTEMVSMNLTGQAVLPNGEVLTVGLRESDAQQSLGQANITASADGRFQVDSFFDIFTEISIDGGANFVAASGSSNLVLFPAPELVALQGPSTVHVFFDGAAEGVAFDDDLNDLDEVIAELVALDMTGVSPWGPLRATLRGDIRSLGRIEERQQVAAGTLDVAPFTADAMADSFFDVWTEITINGRPLITQAALRLEASLTHKPPQGETRYVNPRQARVELIDAATGQGTGIFVLREIHHPLPATEVDQFDVSLGQLLIQAPDGRQELVAAVGPATVNVYFDGDMEGTARDDDGDGRDEVITELAALNLTGTSTQGPVSIGLRSDVRSMGRIEEHLQISAGTLDVAPFTPGAAADSFFDVWPEIMLGTQRLVTAQPLRLVEPNLQHKPPRGEARYISAVTEPVELLDAASGQGTGIFIVREVHHPSPFIEVDSFNVSLGQLLIQKADGRTELVPAEGPAEVNVYFDGDSEGVSFDDDLNGRDEVITELVALNMTGYSSLGPVSVELRDGVRSLGQIEEQQQLTPGTLDVDPFTAGGLGDSFFDVWPLITIGGLRFVTEQPLRLIEPDLKHKPPQGDARYINDIRQPADRVQVFNLNLDGSGSLSFNLYGGQEKWLQSASTFIWYYILPTGELIRWNGVAGQLDGESLGFLDQVAYEDPVERIVKATHPIQIPVLPLAGPVELFTESGLSTGIFIVREVHHPLPFIEHDAFGSSLGQFLVELPGPPGIVTPRPELPPIDGVYRTPQQVHVQYQSGGLQIVLQDLWHRVLVDPTPTVENVGSDEVERFQSQLNGTAVVTSAAHGLDQALLPVELLGPVETVAVGKAGQTTGTFPTEMISMTLTGEVPLPSGQALQLTVREDPARQSLGQVSIAQLSTGQFQLDSFFDIFTEVSIGGGSFVPSTGSTRVDLARSPELVAAEGPAAVNVYFDAANEGVAWDDNLDGRDEVITELVDLNLTGSSPLGPVSTSLRTELRSFGRIDEHTQRIEGTLDVAPFTPGATADSFFDVWTEITIGGQRLITGQPFHLEEPNLQHKPPQGNARYISPFLRRVELLDAVTGAGTGIFILREVHHPLPATQQNQFDISLGQLLIQRPDGERELVPAEGPATVKMFFDSASEGVAWDDDLNGRDEVITELISMDLSGLSSLGPVQVELRTDIRSMGRLEEQQQIVSGVLDIDPAAAAAAGNGFFDVWPVITLGGQRLVTSQPLRLSEPDQLHQPPRGTARYLQNLTNSPVELIDETTGAGSGIFILRNVQHPLPFVQTDTFNVNLGQLLIQLPDGGTELVGAVGPAQAQMFFDGATAGIAFDDDLNGRDEVITELLSMNLTGQSSLGPVEIGIRTDVRSMGRVDERLQLNAGILDVDPFTANAGGEGFFDVWPTFTVGGQSLFTQQPLRLLEPDLQHHPSRGDARFISNLSEPVELFDSGTGSGTGIFIVRQVHHPLPFIEMDHFDTALGQMLIRRPDEELELIAAAGPAEMHVYFDGAREGVAFDDNLDGRDEVFTELVAMNITGASSLGPVEIRVRGDLRSMGRIDEQAQLNPGTLDIAPFTARATAESYLDLWPEVILAGQRLLTQQPLRMLEPNLTHKPPQGGARFVTADSAAPVELFTAAGEATGIFIVRNVFQPVPPAESSAHASSRFVLTLENEAGTTAVLPRDGESTIDVFYDGAVRGDALDDDENDLDEVVSEISRFNFAQQTASPLGTIRVLLDTSVRALGIIEETSNNDTGRLDVDPFFPFGGAIAFYHLPIIVEVDGQPLHPESVIRIQAPLNSWPPVPGATLELPPGRIPLLDASGTATDLFIRDAAFTPLLQEDPLLRSATATSDASQLVWAHWTPPSRAVLQPKGRDAEDWDAALNEALDATYDQLDLKRGQSLVHDPRAHAIPITRRERLFAGPDIAELLGTSELDDLIGSSRNGQPDGSTGLGWPAS